VGDGSTGYHWPPTQVPGLTAVAAIDADTSNTCALRIDGTVVCWGAGFGAGSLPTPTMVAGLANIVEVAVGENSACARREDGRVLCWGTFGDVGQLGDGSGTDSPTPRLVAGLIDATTIHVQSFRACAARSNGQAVCWGNGALGNGSTGRSLTPVDVRDAATGDPATGIVRVEGGDDWACALRSNGEVSCWGSQSAGVVGLAPSPFSSTTSITQPVTGLPQVASISAGRFHLCAVTVVGDVYCWGFNPDGQVGDGTRVHQPTPTLIDWAAA
jgi:alpha-tubulin suppressor-like RCC1 family protein